MLGKILLQGVRADFILMCLLAAIPVLLSIVLVWSPLKRVWFRLTFIWSLLGADITDLSRTVDTVICVAI